MMKTRHIPIRTCVACRQTDEKRDLLRVVRQPDGNVVYDPKGKMSGRGAYVCARVGCIEQARKRKGLERSLKASAIPDALFTELLQHAALEPEATSPEREREEI
jgi:predicted RNA-binding protein YlxR (DUF448 family)